MSSATPAHATIPFSGSEAASILNTADDNNGARSPHVLVVDQATSLPITPAQDSTLTSGSAKTQVTVLPALPAGGNAIGSVSVSASALPTGAALDATLTSGGQKTQVTSLPGGQATMASSLSVVLASDQTPIKSGTRVELTTANKAGTPSAARGAGYAMTGAGSTDDCFNFASTVNAIFLQANISSDVHLYWGTGSSASKAATLGDILIAASTNGLVEFPARADWVAVYAPAATVVNGTVLGIAIFGVQ